MANEASAYIYGSQDFNTSLDATDVNSAQPANGENISVDQDGIYTANYIVTTKFKNALTIGKKTEWHPNLPSLYKTNYGLQRMDGDLCRLTMVFKGVEKGCMNVRYSVNSATQSQPIETHPFFDEGDDIPDDAGTITEGEDAYGYRFGDPIESGAGGGQGSRQAIFEILSGNRIFKGFPLNSQFQLQGVTQYLDIGMSLRATIVTHADYGFETKLDDKAVSKGGGIYYVGQIVDPPNLIAPNVDNFPSAGSIDTKYSWLITKCETEFIGSACKQQVEFTLSGYLGWNRLIYNMQAEALNINETTRFNETLPK